MDVLFLCTGNICRSPMAEVLLRDRLDSLEIDAGVGSAGLLYDGAPASDGSIRAMGEWGIDLTRHRSRIMTPELLGAADLVITMARMHLREAVVMNRNVFGRTFTLKEFVRRGEATGPRRRAAVEDWLAEVGRNRTAAQLLGDVVEDDVVDPIGQPIEVYRDTAVELSSLIDRLVGLVWTPVPQEVQRP